jgi:hypothetical protein
VIVSLFYSKMCSCYERVSTENSTSFTLSVPLTKRHLLSIFHALGVRKNAAYRESSREKSHVQEQGLMTGSSCQAGLGKDGAAQTLGQAWLLQKRELEEVSACMGVSVRSGAVLEHRNFC